MKPKKGESSSQKKGFIKAAKEHEANMDEAAFEQVVQQVAKSKAGDKSEKSPSQRSPKK